MGQTITTDSQTGTVVIALLAVVASLGMTHLWHLFTFFYYQFRAKSLGDGLFRHQQALLRTLPSPGTLVADSFKLWMAWKGTSDRALIQSLTHMSTALLFAAGSVLVSTFSSSMIVSSNTVVRVESPHCGLLDWDAIWISYPNSVTAASESYGPSCYQNGSLPSQCNVFFRPNVPFTTEVVPCPFQEHMCASQAVALDSGLIDLNSLGVDLENTSQVRLRRRTTCAVLPLEGYTEIANASDNPRSIGRPPLPDEKFIKYLYGTYQVGDPAYNFTFGQSLLTSNVSYKFSFL